MEDRRVLLIGFGNPGRLDDGLGPALAEAVEKLGIPHVDVDADYQLTVENSEAAARYETVVFADADTACEAPFYLKPLAPADNKNPGFSSHSVSPAEVLGLARTLFHSDCQGYLLGIRGYEFNEFKEALSEGAERNLASALTFIEPVLRARTFSAAVQKCGGACNNIN